MVDFDLGTVDLARIAKDRPKIDPDILGMVDFDLGTVDFGGSPKIDPRSTQTCWEWWILTWERWI